MPERWVSGRTDRTGLQRRHKFCFAWRLSAPFIFDTLNGTSAGWNGGGTAVTVATTPGAIYVDEFDNNAIS